MDRNYMWSGLDAWKNNDTTSTKHLYQGWYDAEQAVVNLADRPNRYSNMRTKVQQQIYQVRLPLVNINYKFGYFDSLALTDGRLSVNSGMMIDNNLASPYLIKQVGIAGLALDKLEANKEYALQFDTALAINNTGITVQNVNLNNITTGQSITITTNQAAILLSFNQVGKNVLKFTTTMSNGSSYSNFQTINIDANSSASGILNRPNGPSCDPTNNIVQSTIPFQGYEETEATNSFADYHIYYHTVNLTGTDNCQIGGLRKLLKPIIIMDGFDPQDDRSYSEIYDNQLAFINQNQIKLLGDELRDKGYDVIILNFPKLGSTIEGINGVANTLIPKDVKVNGTTTTFDKLDRDGGTDYMERNAFLLVKLIQEVNTTLQANGSTEKLVVIGPSMGGQISRYALAYMEKQQSLGVPNMNHNTRLFLSFDSPNDGANIPVALAHDLVFFGYNGESQEAVDNYNQQLHSVAARQLLIEQFDGLNSNATFHQTFFNNIRIGGLPNSNGFPINCRKAALLNGSGTSIKTYSDGVEILNLHGLQPLIGNSTLKVFQVENNFIGSTGQIQQICNNRVTIPKKIGQIFNTSIIVPKAILNYKKFIDNYNPNGGMDAVQGSTFDATQFVYDGFSAKLFEEGITQNLYAFKPNHCFIPTVSALGFRNTNFNWNNNVTNRNLLCNNEINFDGYFIPPTNEEHITLTAENVAWLTQEIDKGQPNCPKICSYVVNGSNNLCIGSDETYILDVPIPSGCNTIWHTSERYQILSFTNNSVTIRGISDGPTIVKAQIVNPCGADAIITKAIYVGLPYYSTTYKNGIADGNPVSFYFPSQGSNNTFNSVFLGYNEVPNVYMDAIPYGADNITWSVPSGLASTEFRLYNQYGNRAYFGWIFGGANPPGYIQASVSNVCGTYSNIFAFQQVNCGIQGGDPCTTARSANYFTISPNPASNNITIGVTNRHAPVECNGLRALNTSNGIVFSIVNIYDNLGTLVKSYNTKNAKSASIQISNLIIGSYLVEIIQDDYIERQHIIVQR